MDAGLGMRMKKEWGDVKFDYIIDDGAHYPEARFSLEYINRVYGSVRKVIRKCSSRCSLEGSYLKYV